MSHQARFSIRPANRTDKQKIRSLIRKARINPLGVNWKRFHVAVDHDDVVIGCGQIKLHKDGTLELASIVVEETWRGMGVASAIIRHLCQIENQDLWLMCRSDLMTFYEAFGFREMIEPLDMPPYFRRIKRLWLSLTKLSAGQLSLSIMMREFQSGTDPSSSTDR